MELRVLSDYGARERLVSASATEQDIKTLMTGLDWDAFHQVLLVTEHGDYMEVGGSLDPNDGFSVLVQVGKRQHVINSPPATVDELTRWLIDYRHDPQRWRSHSAFT